jgi:hypothetical protein
MQKPKQLPGVTPQFWKKLGVQVFELADAIWLGGVFTAGSKVVGTVLSALHQSKPPLDWDYSVGDLYTHQRNVLWLSDETGQRIFLPQVILLRSLDDRDEQNIKIRSELSGFHAKLPVRPSLDFYRETAKLLHRQFYEAENARLIDWDDDTKTLTFQSCYYFDYLQTNLALDFPQQPLGTLRQQVTHNGQLEALRDSRLANPTGINGLIFSNDGYIIFQHRSENVIIRPGELCSGFSGTIDKIDIDHAIASGGLLCHLDVPREMVEELGIQRKWIKSRHFLGITRELIRGGQPEMFYSLDVDLSCTEILSCVPKDKEGVVKSAYFGIYANSQLEPLAAATLPNNFFLLLDKLVEKDDHISVPFLTNLVLWFHSVCPSCVGVGTS